MALGDDIELGEGTIVLGLIVVIGYFIYKSAGSIQNWVNQVLGLQPGQGGTYGNALAQTVSHPVQTLTTILTPGGDDTYGGMNPDYVIPGLDQTVRQLIDSGIYSIADVQALMISAGPQTSNTQTGNNAFVGQGAF